MTSTKARPDEGARRSWERTARELAARLGTADFTVRGLTSWIAQSAWRRRYYAGQPNMIRPDDIDPDVETVLDALRLIPAARYAVDIDERDLITAARHLGATWGAIGVALGAAESGARQTARGKYRRLGGDVNAAVPGRAAEQAPALVDAVPVVPLPPPVPADDWPLPGGAGTPVPAATFVEPALLDVDQGGGQ